MSMSPRPLLMVAALLGGLVVQSAAQARKERGDMFGDAGRPPDSFVDRSHAAPQMSAAQAAREAQRRYGGGKVLSVDPTGDGYRVKLLRDGDVRIVFIPDR